MKKLSGKKFISFLVLTAIVISILVFNVNAETPIDLSRYDAGESVSFQDALDSSNCIVKGEHVKRWEYDGYYEDEFLVNEIVKGTVDDKVIFVSGSDTDEENVCVEDAAVVIPAVYEAGQEYILVLDRWASVYEDRDTYYAYDTVIRTNELRARNKAAGDLNTSLDKIQHTDPEVEVNGVPFTESTDMKVISDFSDAVILAEPVELFFESEIMETQTYRCKVIDEIQGAAEDKEIFMVVFKDTVQIGEQYVAMLRQADEESLVYTLAAKENAIMDSGDLEMVQELLAE